MATRSIHGVQSRPCANSSALSGPTAILYLSVPLDDEDRTYFNAHRAFTEETLLGLFEPFIVVEKRYIYGTRFSEVRGTGFGTGCYHLRKPATPVDLLPKG